MPPERASRSLPRAPRTAGSDPEERARSVALKMGLQRTAGGSDDELRRMCLPGGRLHAASIRTLLPSFTARSTVASPSTFPKGLTLL